MSDIIIEDIDGNFVELNDKVDSHADSTWPVEAIILFTWAWSNDTSICMESRRKRSIASHLSALLMVIGGTCDFLLVIHSNHVPISTFIVRPSSLGGGRILRRTLSVCPSVCLSVRPSR